MRRGLLAGCAAAAVLLPGPVQAAVAEDGDPVAGWWSRTRLGAPSPVEAPDTVPEGGMQIAGDPTGPIAVSALRAELPEDVRATGLALDVAEARGTVAVVVCAAAARWDPVDGGRLDAAPPADCTVPAQGAVEEGRLVVALDAALPPGPLDVVLLPAEGAVFSVTLQPPTASSVVVAPAVEEPPLSGSSADDTGASPGDGGLATAQAPPTFSTDPFALIPPELDLGAATALPPPLVVGELPALPGDATQAPAVAPPAAGPYVALPATALGAQDLVDPRRHTVPAAMLLVLLLAFAIRLQGEPARAPRSLGGAVRARPAGQVPAEALSGTVRHERGVGRFRGPRSTPAVRL